MPSAPVLQLHNNSWLVVSIEATVLSADQASLAERCETMEVDTMVCSVFSGAKRVVRASVDLF